MRRIKREGDLVMPAYRFYDESLEGKTLDLTQINLWRFSRKTKKPVQLFETNGRNAFLAFQVNILLRAFVAVLRFGRTAGTGCLKRSHSPPEPLLYKGVQTLACAVTFLYRVRPLKFA